MSKKINHIFEYMLFQITSLLVRLLPFNHVYKFGYCIAKWFFPILKSRRNVALRNLHNAFPEKKYSELKQIALRSFQNIAATFLELLWYPNLSKEIIERRVKIENIELIERLLKEGRGLIFLTAHFGSWELAMQAIAINYNKKFYAMAKPQSNILVDKKITKWREKFGLKIITMSGAREILRALQEGSIIGLVADQSAPRESILVEFFGRAVPTFQGPALFALKTRAPIVFGCTIRQEDGTYKMKLALVDYADLYESTEENVIELTRRQVQVTERAIRQYPEQWMWMHKRWKHVPDREDIAKW